MKNFKKLLLVVFSSILGLGIFQFMSKHLTSIAKDNTDDKMEHRTCYEAYIPPKQPQITIEDLKNKLNILEKQYMDKKIDEKTYKQSKDNILNEMKKIN